MAFWIEAAILAVLVSLGLIVGIRAFVHAFVISRRPSHHLATRDGHAPVSPAVDIRPPE
jgi:hypothetical protein